MSKSLKKIILSTKGEEKEAFSSLKKYCEKKGKKYSTLSKKKFPIKEKDGTELLKLEIQR
jgi:hypothetical protein